ncbi:hypothetical protein KSS87_002689 [Heliosperma pusillum]|nr:hypothetical protein KSS87_002689 [Heliosperma pusillum]
MGNARCEASLLGAVWLHGLSGLSLALVFWVAHHFFDVNLVSNPDSTLLLLWVIQCPVMILLYSLYRKDAASCSVGALLVATIAISLGAPVGIKYMKTTMYWSLLMSLLTVKCSFAPAAAIFGSSWADWQRIFANTRPAGPVDFMVCLPAHGAILGSWFGAWPMPLDWERPWQILSDRAVSEHEKHPFVLGQSFPSRELNLVGDSFLANVFQGLHSFANGSLLDAPRGMTHDS